MNRRSVRFTATMLSIIATLLFASGVQPATAQSGPQSGASDPMGKPSRYYLLRDDEVFNPGLGASGTSFYDLTYATNANLQFDQPIVNSQNATPLDTTADIQVAADSGRIIASDYDQVVSVNRSARGGQLSVYFTDQSAAELRLSYNLQGLADRVYTADLMDVGVGDLDKVSDASGRFHDEVAVVYASGDENAGYQVNLTVLDYTNTCQGPISSIQPCGVVAAQTAQRIDPFIDNETTNWVNVAGLQDNIVATAVGDFDGDGVDEIAVAFSQNENTAWISMFRYTNDGAGNRTLKEVTSTSSAISDPGNYSNTGALTLIAGDFDGASDNSDELALGIVQFDGDPTRNGVFQGAVGTYEVAKDLGIRLDSVNYVFCCEQWANVFGGPPVRMQLEPGLFQFDPANGYDFGRRQFAVAHNSPSRSSSLVLDAYSVGTDLSMTQLWGDITPTVNSLPESDVRFSIAAGGYRGVNGASDPRWGLAYMVNSSYPDRNGNYEHVGMLDGATGAVVQDNGVATHINQQNLRMPLVAYDYDGDALYLGAPVQYTVDGVINTDFVLQEPPKHAYYDNNPQSTTYGQVVTVSRKDGFNVSLQDSSNTTFSSKSTDASSTSIGQSTAESASATVGANEDFGVASVSASVTASFGASAGRDFQENQSSYNSQYGSRTVSFSGQTNRDDFVSGRAQQFDIWRYRVYGLTVPGSGSATSNGFYDIVLPGPVEQFAGGGRSFDWYQPLHESGNILSYPSELGANNLPADLGVYTDTTGTLVQQPLVPASFQNFDGTSGTVALQYGSTSGTGYIQGYSHSLKTSIDIGVSAKVSASAFGVSGGVSTSMKAQWSNNSSSSQSSTSNQTTGTSTGITLNKPAGNGNQAYAFSPMFYITQDGTVKAAHSVSVLGNQSGQSFWASIYGAKADPALNLPGRFNPVLEQNELIGWQPDLGNTADSNSSRKQLRGFALQEATLDAATGAYNYLVYAPAAGEQVRVATNVYNYSTGVPVSNLEVQFQAIPYNYNNDIETPFSSCPNNTQPTARGRCIIGQTTVASLGTAGVNNVAQAAVTWDTTGFGPTQAYPTGQYRVYAVLDPNNTIAEIYETEDPNATYRWVNVNGQTQQLKGIDPGQNNEGYGFATIVPAGGSLEAVPPADVFLQPDSLAVLDTRSLQPNSDTASATIGQTTRVRLTLYSDIQQREFNDVLIYDGDPNNGGTLIAQKRVFAGNPDGTSVWFNWLPATAGTHTLYAKVLKDHNDPQPNNGADALSVTVAAPVYRAYMPLMPNGARVNIAQ